MPPYLVEALKISGYWESEKTNYFYFKNRALPEYIVLVSGGHLTEESKEVIKDGFKQLQGSENFGKHITLEAKPQSKGKLMGENLTTPSIEIVPMTAANLQDALFQGYQKNADKAVRRAWRLSPMLLGESEEHTQATARAALVTAEEQVFQPLREDFDEVMNRDILADMQINYWTFKSLGNKTSDKTQVARAVAPYKDVLPVQVVYDVVGSVMGREMPDPPEQFKDMLFGEIVKSFQVPLFPEMPRNPEEAEEKIAKHLKEVHAMLKSAYEERNR
jgi:capsid portal protein